MSRESSPEEGELVEEGEILDEPTQVKSVAQTKQNGISRQQSRSRVDKSPTRRLPSHSSRHSRPGTHGNQSSRSPPRSPKRESEATVRSKKEAQKLTELSQHLGPSSASRDHRKHIFDLEECLDRVVRLAKANEKEEDPELSKSIRLIVEKLYGGLSAFLIHASSDDGKDVALRKSSIRIVQQAHKHLMLFTSNHQKNIRTWCAGKVFGPLLRGESPEFSSTEDDDDYQSDYNEAGNPRRLAADFQDRSRGQAVDLASLPKPIQLPAPVTLPAPVRPGLAPGPAPGPPGPAPGVPAPGPPRPRPPLMPPPPGMVPGPRPPPEPRPPVEPRQPPQPRPPPGNPPWQPPAPRPQVPSPSPPVDHVDQILAGIRGPDPRLKNINPALLDHERLSIQPITLPTPGASNGHTQTAPTGPGIRPPAQDAQPQPGPESRSYRQRKRDRARQRKQVLMALEHQKLAEEAKEPELPQKFQSFQISKGPEKKLLRPINEPESSFSHSSKTSEEAGSTSKDSFKPQNKNEAQSQVSTAQVTSKDTSEKSSIRQTSQNAGKASKQLLEEAPRDETSKQDSLTNDKQRAGDIEMAEVQASKAGFASLTHILPSFLRPPPPPAEPAPPLVPTPPQHEINDHDMGIPLPGDQVKDVKQSSPSTTSNTKPPLANTVSKPANEKGGQGHQGTSQAKGYAPEPTRKPNTQRETDRRVEHGVQTRRSYAKLPQKPEGFNRHEETRKRKEPSTPEAVPGLEPEPFLEVYEERADKRQKQIHIQVTAPTESSARTASQQKMEKLKEFAAKQMQKEALAATQQNGTKKMSLEEELQFNLGAEPNGVSDAGLLSRDGSPFTLQTDALPPGIDAGDSASAPKLDTKKKLAAKTQDQWDLEFDAESDRLYGAQPISKPPSSMEVVTKRPGGASAVQKEVEAKAEGQDAGAEMPPPPPPGSPRRAPTGTPTPPSSPLRPGSRPPSPPGSMIQKAQVSGTKPAAADSSIQPAGLERRLSSDAPKPSTQPAMSRLLEPQTVSGPRHRAETIQAIAGVSNVTAIKQDAALGGEPGDHAGTPSPPTGGTIEEAGRPARMASPQPERSTDANVQAEAISDDVFKYLRQGNLALVLDLDHTLLNSAKWGEVSPKDSVKLEDMMSREEKLPPEMKNLFSIEDIQMWTKLRPHCREFLRALSRKFVMWIHTNGNRQYAETVRDILDPKQELFGDRVVANAGNVNTNKLVAQDLMKKLDAQGLQGLDPITIIIDDTAAVWAGHTSNLVVIERYTYFPAATRQFNLNRPSMLETDRDERADQGQLAVIQKVLVKAHQNALQRFHSQVGVTTLSSHPRFQHLHHWDTRPVLADLRAQVLKGCKLLFSRLWHVGLRNEDQPAWQLASDLGANCTTEPNDSITHLVTSTTLTDKARWAMENGKKIVSPRWLDASSILWQRANESAFQLKN